MLPWKTFPHSKRYIHTLHIVSRWYRLKENIGLIYSWRIEIIKYQPRLYKTIPFPNAHNLKYANMPFEFPGTVNILLFFSGGRSFLYLNRLDATILLTAVSEMFEVNFFNGLWFRLFCYVYFLYFHFHWWYFSHCSIMSNTLEPLSSGSKSEQNYFCNCWSSVNIFFKITWVYLKKKEILGVCTGIIKHSESYWYIFCSVLIPGVVGSATNLSQFSFPRSRKLFNLRGNRCIRY